MEEKQVNGTQADEAQGTEAEWDEVEAGATVDGDAQDDVNGSDVPDVEKLRRLRLSGFLRELVREEGRMEAAELLGVNYRTLVKAEESGELTGRMSDALERRLGTGENPEAERFRDRMAALESGMEALAKEMRKGLEEIRAVVGGVKAGAYDEGQPQMQAGENGRTEVQAQAQAVVEDEEAAAPVSGRPAPPVAGLRPKRPFVERRLDPGIVTEEPADDDPEVYGDAWPLVKEWRSLRAGHPHQGRSLSWLVNEERLLTLELAMLEEHGLTLPPEKQSLRGFGRKGQTSWRWTALHDTRVALRKRELLRWVRRVCTLGLWRR